MPDLWGEIPDGSAIQTPHSIMQEQANLLKQKTNGLLVGEVTRQANDSGFRASLRIVAPSLNNYRFVIITVEYPVTLYPLSAVNNVESVRVTLNNEDQFVSYLGRLLSSEKVSRVIGGLLSQIRSDKEP